MIGIYAIFRKSDNVCVYVGQSKDVDTRLWKHLMGYTKIKVNYNEYYSKVLETFDVYNKENQLNAEAYWINELNPELNIIRDRHNHLTEETKQKISDALKGEQNPMYGKSPYDFMSQEAIILSNKKRSATLKGKTRKLSNKSIQHFHEEMSGRIWMNNGEINKLVKPNELQYYLDNNFKKGKLNKKREIK